MNPEAQIQGSYPIYLPKKSLLTEKTIWAAHNKIMHGKVTITMSNIRTCYWIPSIRKITISINKKCHHCVRYKAMPFPSLKPGQLPKQRTQECHPFRVIGVDYAGPIYCRSKNKAISKSYILLLLCSVSRIIHLELAPNLPILEVYREYEKGNNKAARGGGRVEGERVPRFKKTFQAGTKCLKRINKDEKFDNFLRNESISWKFNLSKAPWWGGQFEWLIGLTKQTLYITVGKVHFK